MSLVDLSGLIVSLVLTLMVFSYLLGENPLSRPLYRIALHVFIGAAAGYTVVLIGWYVIWPRLVVPLRDLALSGVPSASLIISAVPLILSLSLLFKLLRSSLSQVGNMSIAFVVGVGAAAAVGGAVTGTLFPQVRAGAAASAFPLADLPRLADLSSGAFERLVDAGVFLIGTLSALLYFFFSAQRAPAGPARPAAMTVVATIGTVFINVAYAALYAGAVAASLALLADRVAFLREAIGKLSFQ
ncbi:MAG: hypothetical protein HY260_17660 [Chloroflexi bacterium]|nr:hypothetical protein [Chloroflexota bacterium]